MKEKEIKKLNEAIQDLKKAKESLFNLYGGETTTAEIEHINHAISKLESLMEDDRK